jgi:hypothetical protein
VRVLDPDEVAFGAHIKLGQNGLLQPPTVDGQDLIDLLHLNENPALQVRRNYLGILAVKETQPDEGEVHQLFLEAFGYPEDLPDLGTLRPPLGNSCEKSEKTCYYARRAEGNLEPTY